MFDFKYFFTHVFFYPIDKNVLSALIAFWLYKIDENNINIAVQKLLLEKIDDI